MKINNKIIEKIGYVSLTKQDEVDNLAVVYFVDSFPNFLPLDFELNLINVEADNEYIIECFVELENRITQTENFSITSDLDKLSGNFGKFGSFAAYGKFTLSLLKEGVYRISFKLKKNNETLDTKEVYTVAR